MAKQLLIDYSLFQPINVLKESTQARAGNIIVTGLVQACDKPNANRRIYPYDTLYSQVEKYIAGPISENRALGELDHPESEIINLKNVSHNILELWWKGKDLYGKVEILPTPSGNILKALFQSGIKLGISSRGLGSVKEVMREGNVSLEVQPDFELIAFDFVSNPSTHGAFLSPVNESVNRAANNKYDNISKLIQEIIMEF